jgi:hypothetical protein
MHANSCSAVCGCSAVLSSSSVTYGVTYTAKNVPYVIRSTVRLIEIWNGRQ